MPRPIGPLSKAQAADRIRALQSRVRKNTKQLASTELGRIRVTLDTTPDTTAVMQNISALAQGDDVGDRHGRKIHAQHLSIRGSVGKALASPRTQMRMIIFRDNLGTTTAPTLADLFTDENDFFDNHHRLINEQPMKRFTILWDKFIILNENFDGQLTGAAFKFSKKLNFDILYTGAAITDEGKNSLWFLSGSSEASNVPSLKGDIVFKYSDL